MQEGDSATILKRSRNPIVISKSRRSATHECLNRD